MPEHDRWSKWLLETRFADCESAQENLEGLRRLRDTLLAKTDLKEGMTLLDVGAGDGLIAFGALEKLGPQGRVILADISAPLLERSRASAVELGIVQRCDFLNASADDLSGIPDQSIDIVTTRSVLIYVADKARAIREFYRVLKPGGRAALFETVRPHKLYRTGERWAGLGTNWYSGEALEPINDLVTRYTRDLAGKVPASMVEADHFDYLRLCEDAGFDRIDVELHIHSRKPKARLETLIKQSLNPFFPTPAEHMEKIFTLQERQRFLNHMRSLVEAGKGMERATAVYVWATKNSASRG